MGFFSGLFGWSQGTSTFSVPVKPYLPYNTTYVGHVLDVILDTNHPQYDPEKNQTIGTIFWRNALRSGDGSSGPMQFDESYEKAKTANPIDRSNFKVPLPGEQVTIHKAKSSRLDGPDIFLTSKYYYDRVVGMTANNVINSAPFIGINPERLNPFLPGARTVFELAKRFDKKIKNLSMFKEGNKALSKKQVQLNEGDFILQGRFGGSIRFTATPTPAEARKQKVFTLGEPGLPGSPMILMRVKNEDVTFEDIQKPEQLYTQEDLAVDDASLYLCSAQQLGIKLAVPEYEGDKQPSHPLASWGYIFDAIPPEDGVKKQSGAGQDGEESRGSTTSKQTTKPEDSNPSSANQEQTNPEPPANDNEGTDFNPATGTSGFDNNQSAEQPEP